MTPKHAMSPIVDQPRATTPILETSPLVRQRYRSDMSPSRRSHPKSLGVRGVTKRSPNLR